MSIEVDGGPVQHPRISAARRWRMMGLALGFLVAAVARWLVFHRAGPAAPARAIGARLDLAAGDVTVTEAAAATKALSGTPLAIGSRIATGKGARALVRTGDGAARLPPRRDARSCSPSTASSSTTGEVWLDAPRGDEPTPSR